jgi:hypothetical protein
MEDIKEQDSEHQRTSIVHKQPEPKSEGVNINEKI